MVKRRSFIFWFSGAACLAIVAALLYGRFVRSGNGPSRRPDAGFCRAGPTTLPTSGVSPADVAAGPMAGTGLEKLRTCADDVFAPPGAVRHYAFSKKAPAGAEDIVAYTIESNIADVENFYRDRLKQEGYKLVQRKPAMHPGGVSLVFLRKMQHYCVTLRYADKEKKIVKIVLVISRPG